MLILLTHRKMTYFVLVPLNLLHLNACNDCVVFDLEEIIVSVFDDLLGGVINLRLIQRIQKVRDLRGLLICHAFALPQLFLSCS